jgi:prophage regulatory protein
METQSPAEQLSKEVIARVGIKRSMIYRLMGEERFPRSRSLGSKCAVWVEEEIDDWIASVVDLGVRK